MNLSGCRNTISANVLQKFQVLTSDNAQWQCTLILSRNLKSAAVRIYIGAHHLAILHLILLKVGNSTNIISLIIPTLLCVYVHHSLCPLYHSNTALLAKVERDLRRGAPRKNPWPRRKGILEGSSK